MLTKRGKINRRALGKIHGCPWKINRINFIGGKEREESGWEYMGGV